MVVDIQYFCHISNYHCGKFEHDEASKLLEANKALKRTKTASNKLVYFTREKIIEVETVKSLMISLLKQQVAMEQHGYNNLLT